MKKAFIFDVDGTLTPSRGKIDEEFRLWFVDFCIENDVYLVTGSDYPKTQEQLGDYLLKWPVYVYNCSGNDVWADGKRVSSTNWELPEDVEMWLMRELEKSYFPLRTGNHIEKRLGTANFSIVGRNATLAERKMYVAWDQKTDERKNIVKEFNTIYNPRGIQAQIGGETGFDITEIGKDKSQIFSDFDSDTFLYFFGDACQEGGNDYPLAEVILKNNRGFVYNVKDYHQTWELLKNIKEQN